MKNIAMNVAASMPPITPVAMAWRDNAPAPLDMARGNTLKTSDVITMGRNLSPTAIMTDSIMFSNA